MGAGKTIGDVARELKLFYGNALRNHSNFFEKGEKCKIFQIIIEELYAKHKETFGYVDISSFKSDLIRAKNSFKKEIKKHEDLPKEENVLNKPSNVYALDEGMTSFTQKQIIIYGLNPESY
jgi:hypothetical protein